MNNFALICEWDSNQYFIISENVFGKLVYYSHILPMLISLALALFVFLNNKKSLESRLLLLLVVAFNFWSFFDLILWATDKPEQTIFFWSALVYIEPLIYAITFYLVFILISNKDLNFRDKLIYCLLFVPIIIFAPTALNLLGYDFTNCDREAIEGPLWLYTYLVEIVFVCSIVILGIRSFIKNKGDRQKILLITLGAILFLLSFSWGNITGSLSVDWEIGQYGLFGLPIFIGVLSYLIIKYKEFDVKMITAQAITALIWITLFSILFVRTVENVRIIVAFTLLLVLIFGLLLIRSIKKEVEQRDKIEMLAINLEKANLKLHELDKLKSEFLSLATHQIRAPLTAIKGYASMMSEGDYGELPPEAKNSSLIIEKSCQSLINIVNDFLNISRIEQGKMTYDLSDEKLNLIFSEVIEENRPNVESANLKLNIHIEEGIDYSIKTDRGKMKQIIGNIIDNATKYTKEGSIYASLRKESGKFKISIKDTGLGIDPSEIDKLFSKFSRTKDANKVSVTGSGLGLYIAKRMINDLGGDIKVISEGLNKGAEFIIEI